MVLRVADFSLGPVVDTTISKASAVLGVIPALFLKREHKPAVAVPVPVPARACARTGSCM